MRASRSNAGGSDRLTKRSRELFVYNPQTQKHTQHWNSNEQPFQSRALPEVRNHSPANNKQYEHFQNRQRSCPEADICLTLQPATFFYTLKDCVSCSLKSDTKHRLRCIPTTGLRLRGPKIPWKYAFTATENNPSRRLRLRSELILCPQDKCRTSTDNNGSRPSGRDPSKKRSPTGDQFLPRRSGARRGNLSANA